MIYDEIPNSKVPELMNEQRKVILNGEEIIRWMSKNGNKDRALILLDDAKKVLSSKVFDALYQEIS